MQATHWLGAGSQCGTLPRLLGAASFRCGGVYIHSVHTYATWAIVQVYVWGRCTGGSRHHHNGMVCNEDGEFTEEQCIMTHICVFPPVSSCLN